MVKTVAGPAGRQNSNSHCAATFSFGRVQNFRLIASLHSVRDSAVPSNPNFWTVFIKYLKSKNLVNNQKDEIFAQSALKFIDQVTIFPTSNSATV